MAVITRLKKALEEYAPPSAKAPRWRWYHGLAFYAIAQGLTFGLSGLVSLARGKGLREALFSDVAYFRDLKQVLITPPSGAFGPAWTINNISVLYGNLRALNMPDHTPGRNTYLALQVASWLNYVLFSAAYFSLRSPLNAFIITLTMFVLTVASGFVAIFRLKDTKIALSLATLFVWLIIALTVASFQVLWNHDEFYDLGPFVEVNPALEKKSVR